MVEQSELEIGVNMIETYTGRFVDPFDLRPEDVDIRDIAYVLSGEWRFGGHCHPRYSDAQHCLNVAELLDLWYMPKDIRLQGLLHDASEAYLRDIPSPVKQGEQLSGYRELEKKILGIIANAFGVFFPFNRDVKQADGILAWVEGSMLMHSNCTTWIAYKEKGEGIIDRYGHLFRDLLRYPMGPNMVERAFLDKFEELRKEG